MGAPSRGAPSRGAPGAPSRGDPSRGAPSRGAPFWGAPFWGAPFWGAPFWGAPFWGAPFWGARALPPFRFQPSQRVATTTRDKEMSEERGGQSNAQHNTACEPGEGAGGSTTM
jgi:hypothetical protein